MMMMMMMMTLLPVTSTYLFFPLSHVIHNRRLKLRCTSK